MNRSWRVAVVLSGIEGSWSNRSGVAWVAGSGGPPAGRERRRGREIGIRECQVVRRPDAEDNGADVSPAAQGSIRLLDGIAGALAAPLPVQGQHQSSVTTVALRSRDDLKSPGGFRTAPAKFVREVRPGEMIVDLIGEGKAATWVNEAEHAIISLKRESPGRIQRVVVSGGRDGIDFIERDGKLFVEMEDSPVQVQRIIGHTHPRVTGPSQGDLDALVALGQVRSYIIELGGEPGGTLIRPK